MRSRKIALLLLSITLLFTITAFQSSTILHQTVAHDVSAAANDGAKPELMPGTSVVLRAADFDFDSFIPPPIVSGGLDQNSRAAPFNVTYTGFTPQAEAAFQYAVDIWSTLITSTVTIRVDANWTDLDDPLILGRAGPGGFWRNFSGAPAPNTWYPVAMANSLYGSDLDSGGADIIAEFNSGFNWYLGTDGGAATGQYDFVTVVLHELGHGLGFTGSGAYDDGTGTVECDNVPDQGCVTFLGFPTTFDNFVEDSSGLSVLGYPTPSPELGALFTSGNLYWNSPRAVLINGGPPELYAPATWAQGSSYSHLDETAFPPANPHSLMTPQLASVETIHDPGQITLCMFEDMGWDAACVAPTAAVWTGDAGTNWSDNGNWDIGVAPTSVVDVTIPITPTGGIFPTVDADTTIGGLTVAGDITFGADVGVQGNLTVQSGGSIDLQENGLTVEGTFNNSGDLSQTFDVPGSGTTRFLHITDAAGTTDKYYGVDLTPAGGPLGSTTVVVSGNQAGCAAGTDLGFVSRCVDVTPTTAADTTIRVWYTETERAGLDASKLVLYHNGGTWAVAGSSSSGSEGGTTCAAVGGSACWVEAAGVTSFSPFAPGLDTSPTAVRLGGLNAAAPAGWEIGIWVLLSFAIGLTYVGWISRRRPPA